MSSCESSTGSSPVLRDLHEKKQSLRRIASEVGSMASELRHVRSRMAAQEASLAQETANRQIELQQLQESLESKSSEAQTSASVVAEQAKIPERGWVVPDQNWNIVTKLKIRKLFELADKIAERRDRELKELHVKALLRENGIDKQKFWESSRFKYLVSLSVVILLVFAKQ